jgi:hypothetical protein
VSLARGSRVTLQPRTWWDGEPVEGWPDPLYVGVVLRVDELQGLPMARVKYPTGRAEWHTIYGLEVIP